jgi:hypothetical protein
MKRPARRTRTRTLKQLIRRGAFWLPSGCTFFASLDTPPLIAAGG